ncbi:MAG: hypothetical protein GWO24_22410, partial [Akkermansiaceae bacterium]|nr:hypothetical protein [Akkermansiaceae bacterium]
MVVCKDEKLFARFYDEVEVSGVFEKSLGDGSDTINLRNAEGGKVDSLEYDDEEPWPVSPDGYSASLERICPTSEGDTPLNWAPSILSDDYDRKPSGTPGKVNSVFQKSLPPIIEKITASAEGTCAPGDSIEVWANVKGTEQVELLYRIVKPGGEGEEVTLPMERERGGRFKASIPTREANRIVRFRVRATGRDGAVRHHPLENEIRPAVSVYVSEQVLPGGIPVAQFFNVGEEEFNRGAEYREQAERPPRGAGGPGGFGRPPGGGPGGFPRGPETAEERARRDAERARRDAERLLRDDSLQSAWGTLTLKSGLGVAGNRQVLDAFRAARKQLAELREELNAAEDGQKAADPVPDRVAEVG